MKYPVSETENVIIIPFNNPERMPLVVQFDAAIIPEDKQQLTEALLNLRAACSDESFEQNLQLATAEVQMHFVLSSGYNS